MIVQSGVRTEPVFMPGRNCPRSAWTVFAREHVDALGRRWVYIHDVFDADRTRSPRCFVPPELLRRAGLDEQTTLVRIEPHRLRELILQDLRRYPDSGAG